MATYTGSIRIEGDAGSAVECVVTVGDGRLAVVAGGGQIGDWSLEEVSLSRSSEGLRLEVEGERLLFATDEAEAFAADAGLTPSEPPQVEAEPSSPEAELSPPETSEAAIAEAGDGGQNSAAWWKFWDVGEWKGWWQRRQEWRRYQSERRALNNQVAATQQSLPEAEARLAAAQRDRAWAEEVAPKQVPVKTAKGETGLASVDQVSLLETRKQEGKDVWTLIDQGSVHLTDRKMVFAGSKNVEFRYDKLTAATASAHGLYLAVSTRKRSHILSGPSNRLHALLVAAQAVAAGSGPTVPFEEDIAKWSSEQEKHRKHLEDLRSKQRQLHAPPRPLSPGWIPASVLFLFLLIGGALASPDTSTPIAVGTTTTTVHTPDTDETTPAAATTTTTTALTTTTEPAPEDDEGTATAAGFGGEISGELIVWFFDVGQGDSTLLQGPDFTILIDAGRHDRADVVPHLRSAGVSEIDLLVGTHPHADHIGQFPEVLQAFPVTEVWMSGDSHTTLTYERVIDAILSSDAGYDEPRAGETQQIGSARIEVVNPTHTSGDLHDGSVSLRIVYGQVAFMFTGDAEAATEAAMVARDHDLQAQVLQVGHHGSRTSSTTGFLQAVNPEVAIYSAGANNQYGHPHAEAIERLLSVGAAVYGTDVHGTIRVFTDGTNFHVDVAGDAVTATTVTTITATTTTAAPAPSGCGSGQVDINSAGFEELQQIIHIGPDRAQQILQLRPFRSVDDMTRISGIGEARLAAIKNQGVACVP